ncbi:MAG: hypothetical protein HQ522_01805 [Bacteroidetes bacterium]|nr:hypothetical protein [Bacteroidota bacterium]
MQTNSNKDIPVYLQIIKYIKSGFTVLDETIQQEIIAFLKSQQHKSGGFTDRAGNPDLYYSLFGFWLSLAAGSQNLLEKFELYINSQKENQSLGAIEQMALVLINAELLKTHKSQSLLSLFTMVFIKGRKIEISYKIFLLTLAVDSQNRNKSVYYFFARIGLYFYKLHGNLPCSIQAALTFAKQKVGLKFTKEQEKLVSYYVKEGGFKTFDSILSSDILSTAVALFVLRKTDYDLRLIAPDCLEFVQNNYNSGAFLSGDGDKTRDLEYTFYGLLALGTLVEDSNGK